MFKTKSEVDKHVGKIFLKAKSDSEKNRECFKIARLYYGIKEYKYAKQYLANYLSEISDDPNAWKLMAEIAELDDNWQKAIDCYAKYYETNQHDTKILLKICSCYLKLDRFDSNSATKWLNKAEQFNPYDTQVIEFKERLYAALEQTSSQTNQWETFLLKGLEKNYYNQELHFKLVKMYLKNDNSIYKAIKHLLIIEQKSLFDSSTTWHKSIIELIETCSHFILNDPKYADKYELINLVYLIINYHFILTSLKDNSIEDILNLFIKFDHNLFRFESYLTNIQVTNVFNLNESYQLVILDEIKSHYHYICGLYILKSNSMQSQIVNLRPCTPASDDTDDSTVSQLENYDYLNKSMLACVCMANSSLFSKPNNKQLFTNNIDKLSIKKEANELQSCVLNLFKLAHKDSNWRYSNTGNWLKFQMNKTNDEIKFLKSIKKFSKISNIRQTIADSIGLSKVNDKSFILDSTNFQYQIDKEKFYVMDHLSLDYADKYCLSNQSFNLKYLVWHTLVNIQINKNLDEFLPYFYFRNMSTKGIKFGVENFNICNLESLSLLDMKLFLYSVSFQTLSQLNKSNDLKLEPYWLQSNLCSTYQYDWWFNTFHYLFNRDYKAITDYTLDSINESGHSFNLDIKKQTELAKILELLRLKHGLVKIVHNSKQEKFKANLKICIKLAKYFQMIVDQLTLIKQIKSTSPSKESSISNQSMYFPVDCELEYSPQEKLDYLKKLTAHYWSYVTQQSTKLKQLRSLEDSCLDDLASSTVLADHTGMASYNESMSNQSKITSPAFETQFYFDYAEPDVIQAKPETTTPSLDSYDLCGDDDSLKNEEIKQKLSLISREPEDLIIQTGLLNLIAMKVDPTDETNDTESLKEAIALFSQLETDRIEMNSTQMAICKRIIHFLNEYKKKTKDVLQDVNILLNFVEKKLKVKQSSLVSTSDLFPMQPVSLTFNQSDLNSTIENEIPENVTQIKEEPISIEKEEESQKKEVKPEVVAVKQAEPPIEQKIEQPKVEEIVIKEPIKVVILEPVKVLIEEPVRIATLSPPVPQPKPIEIPSEQDKFNKQQNDKIQLLIETLNEQRMSHIKFNSQILEEQFSFLKDQHKKLNVEINQLSKCKTKRLDILTEFRSIVKNFNELCDMDTFNRQFNVFYWLFQQQPNIGQFFIEQNKQLFEPKPKLENISPPVEMKKPEQSIKKELVPNNNTSYSTTFSQNEYCTPKQDRSQISVFTKQPATNTPQSFLQKPICDLKFPAVNINMLERLKDSANKFKQEALEQSELNYEDVDEEDDEEYDEEYEGDENDENEDEQVIAGNLSQSNKQDTFLSCNNEDEEEQTGYYTNRNTKYFSNLSATTTNEERSLNKSSIECLFDQQGQFYEFNEQRNSWTAVGRATFQLIADDGVGQKGHFQAHIICNLMDKNKSTKFDLSENTIFNNVVSIPNSISWSPTQQLTSNKSGAFKFDKDNCVQDLKNVLNECQLRIKRNSRNDSFSSGCSQNNLIRKEITFCLNDNLSLQYVTLNVSKSLLNQYMISILHDSNLLFQHVLRKDQKFETSEKVKQLQYVCKYSIDQNLIQLNSLNNVNLNNLNPLNIKLIFQTKLDLNDFLNLFKN